MLAICGAPQALKCWKEGHADGMSHGTIWLWYIGEWLTFIYILSFPDTSWPLIFNYAANLVFVSVMVKFKYYPVERDDS